MDKNESISFNENHEISIKGRKSIYLTGVNKIESFDNEEFLMETSMGFLVLKGEELEIIKLDTTDGIVSIKGILTSMAYVDQIKKQNKEGSFFNKLFR